MNRFDRFTRPLMWFMALLLAALAAGCGGGGGGAPILGGGGAGVIPFKVTHVDPLPGAVAVPTNTRILVATFTKDVDPASVTAANFSLACAASPAIVAVPYVVGGAGKVVELALPALPALLPAGTLCTATITTGLKDTTGVALTGNFVWRFTTAVATDITPPTVNVISPLNGATNVAFNAKVSATFSEGLDPSTINATSFTLKQGAIAVPGTVSYVGGNAVFTPAAALAPLTTYTATIKGGPLAGIKDLALNAMLVDFVWSFTTAVAPDVLAPTVTSIVPVNGAINVPFNAKVGATFSEAMDPLSITVVNFALNETVSGASVPGVLSYTGVSALFIPLNPLKPSMQYTVTVKGGAGGVADLAGNVMAGNFVVSWATGVAPDIIAPTVTAINPANGAINVPFNANVGATFSEAMNPLTITNLNFSLNETVSGAAVTGTLSYSGVSALFIPLNPLKASTQYTVTVKGGAGGVADLAGNVMAANFVWSWTTGVAPDTTAPTVTGISPANLATSVPVNNKVSAAFSEAMNPLSITNVNFTLKETVSGAAVVGTTSYSGVTAVFAPLNPLKFSTQYTATVKGAAGGVKDLAGNVMVNNFVWSFTTAVAPDTTPPTITATLNANGAINVPVNTKVGATFSEAMNPLTVTNLNFSLKETVSGAAVAGTLSYSGVNALFIPLNPLKFSTRYTATAKGGAGGVADLAGNVMVSNYVWSWTTGVAPDVIPPTVVGTLHANGAINVPINTQVGATFSEVMNPLTITNLNFTLKETLAGTAVVGTTSYAGVNALFIPLNPLKSSTQYTVTVKGGAGGVADLAGNVMAVNFVISWTTAVAADTTPPTVLSTNPPDLAVGVCLNKTINATFSEAMDPLTLTNATITLAPTATPLALVNGLVAYDALTHIATFNPTANLAATTNYVATIKGGGTGVKDMAGNAMLVDKVTHFTTGTALCTAPIVLGAAGTFGGFGGGAGMTNQGVLTVITGDIGTTGASTTLTGFHDSTGDGYTETPLNVGAVGGRIYTAAPPPVIFAPGGPYGGNAATFAIATAAASDALIAYNSMSPASLPGGVDPGAGQLGGLTLFPGIYKSAGATFLLTGSDLTLDGQGDTNAVWVFQTAAGLTIGAPGFPRNIILINGAQAKNVFWYVGSAARIENRCSMVGTIIASAGVTISTAGELQTTTLNGRALGLGASVTVVNTLINVPAP